eukprot:1145381-Pelagomonas_calceolata.AAC.6
MESKEGFRPESRCMRGKTPYPSELPSQAFTTTRLKWEAVGDGSWAPSSLALTYVLCVTDPCAVYHQPMCQQLKLAPPADVGAGFICRGLAAVSTGGHSCGHMYTGTGPCAAPFGARLPPSGPPAPCTCNVESPLLRGQVTLGPSHSMALISQSKSRPCQAQDQVTLGPGCELPEHRMQAVPCQSLIGGAPARGDQR